MRKNKTEKRSEREKKKKLTENDSKVVHQEDEK